MNEIREILRAVDALSDGERAVLATVIDVQGSGYRLPGARMLVLGLGRSIGTVSGGCLEADVLERSARVLASGRTEVFTYDTTDDHDPVYTMNMGCRGVIRILLEVVDRDSAIVGLLRANQESRRRQVFATLVAAGNRAEAAAGGRIFIQGPAEREFDRLPRFLVDRQDLHDACSRFFSSGTAYTRETLETPRGPFEFAFENLPPPISLLLFGAGADAVPLVQIAAELGWRVTVHDHRPAFLTPKRFPAAHELVHQNVDEPPGSVLADIRTAAVIMTHNYGRDSLILPSLLRSDVFYVGALGPKQRTEQLIGELAADGEKFESGQLGRLYAPVGLDIGADTPEGIALAIVGEIQSVLATRDGGHLRDRQGSIYDRE